MSLFCFMAFDKAICYKFNNFHQAYRHQALKGPQIMKLTLITPAKSLNKAYLKQSIKRE